MNRSARLKKLGFTRSRGHKPQSQPRKEQGDRSRRRLRRRLSGGLLLMIALTISGGVAAVLTPTPQVAVADAAVYFQVSTGRMPAMRGEAQAPRKAPIFDEAQIDAIGAYVQANGGGPTVVRNPDGSLAMRSLRGEDLARGGDLFRLNCASCHNFTGKGGALSSGKYAPDLAPANEQQ